MLQGKDLTKEAPRSPNAKLGGYVILARTMDKCLATINGTIGEYHFDCPLDNQAFTFKGITGDQFKAAVQAAKSEADVVAWLEANGTKRTAEEIAKWSDETSKASLYSIPEKREYFVGACSKLGLDPATTSTFGWLEADDKASYAQGESCGCSCQM